ncbi:single-stranded DNA-binding protein [Leucobacter sp. W1478]|uniref:single-stranded DNA-binding protein n=1 Tax=Leucobacter sp. W1478 TaxID=3439065 RepID=UPI003F2C8070
MSIHTQESVSGFVATDPKLTTSANGNQRLYFRFGQEHFRREEDGSFTQLETSFHHLVMFGRSAELASDRFTKGDNFIAEGYQQLVSFERDGQPVEGEEFVAKRIGHDAVRTRYDVDRSPRKDAGRDAPARAQGRAFDFPAQRAVFSPPALGL